MRPPEDNAPGHNALKTRRTDSATRRILELKAVRFALEAFRNFLRGRIVAHEDNQGVVAILTKSVSRDPTLHMRGCAPPPRAKPELACSPIFPEGGFRFAS